MNCPHLTEGYCPVCLAKVVAQNERRLVLILDLRRITSRIGNSLIRDMVEEELLQTEEDK